ncbi:MAG TPA: acyltransferase [Acidimicrobiales bacterium]|nr:acyltransferase [Acidimicrobiales bacterium]
MSASDPAAPERRLPPAAAVGRPKVGHLGAIDLVRFLTVAGVIAVHCTSLTAARSSLAAGGVLAVLHVTRSVFLFLSAFVLTYSFQRRPLGPRAFWRRRYPLVVAPYVVWSAVYILTDGEVHRGPAYLVEHFVLDLFDGGAHFHLYFLLLTFQLYLVFPPLMRWLAAHPRSHRPLVLAALAFQLAFTGAIHYRWDPPVLGIWLTHSGSWLPSYVLYIVGGLVAALHFDAVTGWVRAHGRLIAVALVASVALAEVSYVCDLRYLGFSPIHASGVFQPTVTIEAVTSTLALYALGLWVIDRVADRGRKFLERSADASFGVYLAHPLLVGGILDLAAVTGLDTAVGHLPGGAVEALAVFALVPFVYAVTFTVITRIRRTPASLWLTGRRAPRPARADLTAATASPPVV